MARRLQSIDPHVTIPAYLDDANILIKRITADRVLNIIQPIFSSPYSTLRLNSTKTRTFDSSIYEARHPGIEILGSKLGNVNARQTFLNKKIDTLSANIQLLSSLPLQQRQLLFRFCIVPTPLHLIRTLKSSEPPMLQTWIRADGIIDREFRLYLYGPNADIIDMNLLRSLPLKLGGFGNPSYTTLVTTSIPSLKSNVRTI